MEACNAAESFSLNSKKEFCMSLAFPLKSATHYGSEAGNDQEWAQNSEENLHFKSFVMLIGTPPWGYTAFSLKIKIRNRVLPLFSEFAKKKCNSVFLMSFFYTSLRVSFLFDIIILI